MIVGICGLAGVGKDTSADHLVANHGFSKVALADPLKRIARDVYAFTDLQLWGPSAMRNEPDLRYLRERHDRHDWQNDPKREGGFRCLKCELSGEEGGPECLVYLTPRFALQLLGTEWGRHCYGNTWVDYALRLANDLLVGTHIEGAIPKYDARSGLSWGYAYERSAGVVISDVRFMNEIDAIHNAGGRVIRLTRQLGGLEGAAAQHLSEKEQLGISDSLFDAVIANDSCIAALGKRLDAALQDWT